MDYGVNQDLFYGSVTNVSMGMQKSFGPSPAAVAISAASASNLANSLGLPLSGTASEFILEKTTMMTGISIHIPFSKRMRMAASR